MKVLTVSNPACFGRWLPVLFWLAFASTATALQSGDFTYKINSPDTNTVTITDYTGTGGAVVIPSTIDSKSAGIPTNTLNSIGKPAATTPVIYRELLWTNGVFFQPTFAAGGSNSVNRVRPAISDLPSKAAGYQVIVLPPDKASANAPKDDIRYWPYGASSTNKTAQKKESSEQMPVQILVIEPLNAHGGVAPDSFRFREYTFSETRPELSWYEWFNPREFLPKWGEFWTTETNATAVVLIMSTF